MLSAIVRRFVAGLAIAACASGVSAEDKEARPVFDAEGNVHVPAFDLPPSGLMSREAAEFMKMRARMPMRAPSTQGDIGETRRQLEMMLAPQVAKMRELYPVDVAEQVIANVPTRVVTPKGKPADKERVLINLHGGAFSVCADACAMLESAPIASSGGFKVITVNYRMAPEAAHPAALEDIAAVYRELLKTYKSKQIGIYGCSAGGALAGQAAAWLPAHGLPQAGAIGIFGAGAVRFGTGDSAYVAGYIDGSFPPPALPGAAPQPPIDRGYFAQTDLSDPTISPALHPEVLAKFPPSLIITGSRAMDMSPAIYTNSQLLKAGVRSTLVVAEGMSHCYMYMPNLPEAHDAYQVTVNFFRENLR